MSTYGKTATDCAEAYEKIKEFDKQFNDMFEQQYKDLMKYGISVLQNTSSGLKRIPPQDIYDFMEEEDGS